MPRDYYLLIDGITGESQAAMEQGGGMTDNIELVYWNFGASSPPHLGGKGLSAGKPSFSDFTCAFELDSASYQILKNLCEGTHIASATFTGRKTGGGPIPYKYLLVTLTNCFVTGFSTGGQSKGIPAANLSLAFETIEYEYYTQSTLTGSTTLAGQAQYDVKQVRAS
jgi:type VI protein secretion system component Hcp